MTGKKSSNKHRHVLLVCPNELHAWTRRDKISPVHVGNDGVTDLHETHWINTNTKKCTKVKTYKNTKVVQTQLLVYKI